MNKRTDWTSEQEARDAAVNDSLLAEAVAEIERLRDSAQHDRERAEHMVGKVEHLREALAAERAKLAEAQEQLATRQELHQVFVDTCKAAEDDLAAERAKVEEMADKAWTAMKVYNRLVEALEAILEALRLDAPGTPLNNRKYDALGIQARAALAAAKAGEEKP